MFQTIKTLRPVRLLLGALVLTLLLSALQGGSAAAANYTYIWDPAFPSYDYVSTTTNGTAVDVSGASITGPLDLGFTFNYFDLSASQLYIDTRGQIGFGLNGAALDAVVKPLPSELDLTQGGRVRTVSGGAAGERYFVVGWIGVPVKDKGGSRSFQVVLYEDNSDILFQYQTLRGGEPMDTNPVTAVVGIESAGGTASLFLDGAQLDQIKEGKSILFSESELTTDSDVDGLLDRYEVFYNLEDPLGDEDTDGWTNQREFTEGTSPRQQDSDGDSLPDSDGVPEKDPDPNPLDNDGDKDSIPDGNEKLEARETPDADGDGYSDPLEIVFGTDPSVDASVPEPLSSNYQKVTTSIGALLASPSIVDGDILYLPPGTYTEDIIINKGVTLVGAGPALTFIKGRVTISGVGTSVLTGITIEGADTGVTITDHADPTGARLFNVVLKNCINGVFVSGGVDGGPVSVRLDQIKYEITEPLTTGYGVKIENLGQIDDGVEILNAAISLAGSPGAVIIDNSGNTKVTGSNISGTYGTGITILGNGSTQIKVENNSILANRGTGIEINDGGPSVLVTRNSIAGNGGNGVAVFGAGEVGLVDNEISENDGYGLEGGPGAVVNNSGNGVENNKAGNYSDSGTFNRNETAAEETGVTAAGKEYGESAAWLRAAKGGTVAVLDPFSGYQAGVFGTQFGASVTVAAGGLSNDTHLVLASSTESLPALTAAFSFPVQSIPVTVTLDQGSGNGSLTLPVATGYSADTGRVFRLIDGERWEEINEVNPLKPMAGSIEPTLPQLVRFESPLEAENTFVVVADLPIVPLTDTGVGGGCRVAAGEKGPGSAAAPLDLILLLLPLFFLNRRRRMGQG